MLKKLTHAFPLWLALGAAGALVEPRLFTWFSGPLIPFGLGMIMLGMGITLTPADFSGVLKHPGGFVCGVSLQYLVMPFLGWALAWIFRLPTEFAVGLILVASCPGGTASNVITYLAGARLSLSVAMTALSTFLAVLATPALTALLAGSRVDVPFWKLLSDTFQVVIIPVTAGLLLRRYFPQLVKRVEPAAPLMAVVFIVLIVASIVGAGKEIILTAGFLLLAAIFLLHLFGFMLGYILARTFGHDKLTARTISIEVGMQNSGLGVVLARANFAAPAFAIPSAISSVFHSLIGSAAAAYWRARPVK